MGQDMIAKEAIRSSYSRTPRGPLHTNTFYRITVLYSPHHSQCNSQNPRHVNHQHERFSIFSAMARVLARVAWYSRNSPEITFSLVCSWICVVGDRNWYNHGSVSFSLGKTRIFPWFNLCTSKVSNCGIFSHLVIGFEWDQHRSSQWT